MKYYLLTYHTPPRVLFAHGYSTAGYVLHPEAYEGLELTYIERGAVEVQFPDGTVCSVPENAVWFIDHTIPPAARCPRGEHSHFTVGFERGGVREMDCRQVISMLSRNVLGQEENVMQAVVPAWCAGAADGSAEQAIRSVVLAQESSGAAGNLLGRGHLLRLLGELTRIAEREAARECGGASPRSENLSFYHAQRYIAARIDKRLTVSAIALELKLSPGYLSRLFQKSSGMTVVEYINRAKLHRVCALLSDRGITLSAAGEAVGIYNTNYLSRMFKKYMGISYREYRALQNNY